MTQPRKIKVLTKRNLAVLSAIAILLYISSENIILFFLILGILLLLFFYIIQDSPTKNSNKNYKSINDAPHDAEKDDVTQVLPKEKIIDADKLSQIALILSNHPWLREEIVPKEVAEEFVKKTAWWDHPTGQQVRSPKHYKRIWLSPIHGWVITYGANLFLIGKAIERSRRVLLEVFEDIKIGKETNEAEIVSRLKKTISGAVANSNGDEYDGYYPDKHGELVFGTQSIDLNDGAKFMLTYTGIDSLLI